MANPTTSDPAAARVFDALRFEVASIRHLTQQELARRWSVSPRTLERWRWLKQGPDYLKIGGRVVYRREDVELFEALQLQKGGLQLCPGSQR
jgi:hypothetical protein